MPGMLMAVSRPEVSRAGRGLYVARTALPMSGHWLLTRQRRQSELRHVLLAFPSTAAERGRLPLLGSLPSLVCSAASATAAACADRSCSCSDCAAPRVRGRDGRAWRCSSSTTRPASPCTACSAPRRPLLGGALVAAAGLGHAEAWLSLVLGAVVAAFGLAYLGAREPAADAAAAALARPRPRGRPAARRLAATAGLGALNGLLPCGLVYARSCSSPRRQARRAPREARRGRRLGAGGMLAFGAGHGSRPAGHRARRRGAGAARPSPSPARRRRARRGRRRAARPARCGPARRVSHLTIGALVLW